MRLDIFTAVVWTFSEAEIGMVNVSAPAAIASSAPLRLGTSAWTEVKKSRA